MTEMSLKQPEPKVLQAPEPRERTPLYPWLGLVGGILAGVLTGHPISMVVWNFHNFINGKEPLDIAGAFLRSFAYHMWPMILLYALAGGIFGTILGLILQRLQEHRLRLDNLHQEFELQVATLRHHYKNLALGIHGFSSRIRKKLNILDECFRECARTNCPTHGTFAKEFTSVDNSVVILEEAAQRLTYTLGQELIFLKALTSESLTLVPRDFFPLLIHCIKDLQNLRFRDKAVRVEINGAPLSDCRESLVFPFEPYTLEVILQNVIGNAMKFGDNIHIGVAELDGKVRIEVRDNGPGMEVEKLQSLLLMPGEFREAESTHLGLKVSIHLLEKYRGRLLAWSRPGAGAKFIIEFPKAGY